jgi:hypothetical protein
MSRICYPGTGEREKQSDEPKVMSMFRSDPSFVSGGKDFLRYLPKMDMSVADPETFHFAQAAYCGLHQ